MFVLSLSYILIYQNLIIPILPRKFLYWNTSYSRQIYGVFFPFFLFSWQRLRILDLRQFDKLNYQSRTANGNKIQLDLCRTRKGDMTPEHRSCRRGNSRISCGTEEKWVGTFCNNIRSYLVPYYMYIVHILLSPCSLSPASILPAHLSAGTCYASLVLSHRIETIILCNTVEFLVSINYWY